MKYLFTIVLLFSFSSCQKDRLEGESNKLVGTWKWIYSVEHRDTGSSVTSLSVSASNYQDDYFIDFEQKGKAIFKQSENVVGDYRIIFDFIAEFNSTKYDTWFTMHLNNDPDLPFSGWFNSDTLVCSSKHLPLQSHMDGRTKVSYSHYYAKVQ